MCSSKCTTINAGKMLSWSVVGMAHGRFPKFENTGSRGDGSAGIWTTLPISVLKAVTAPRHPPMRRPWREALSYQEYATLELSPFNLSGLSAECLYALQLTLQALMDYREALPPLDRGAYLSWSVFEISLRFIRSIHAARSHSFSASTNLSCPTGFHAEVMVLRLA